MTVVHVQAAWMLKMRALTEQLYVDEVDMDEEGIAETLMDNNAIANVPRPGTSLKQPSTGTGAISRGVRYDIHVKYVCFTEILSKKRAYVVINTFFCFLHCFVHTVYFLLIDLLFELFE